MRRIVTVALAVAVASGLSGCALISTIVAHANSSQGTVQGDGEQQNVFHLAVGQCVNDAAEFALSDAPGDVSSVPVVDCALPHDSEVFANETLEGDTYPGSAVVEQQAHVLCEDDFAGYIGASYDDATSLDFTSYYPTSTSWRNGDRLVTCEVIALDDNGDTQKVTGSLKGLRGVVPIGS